MENDEDMGCGVFGRERECIPSMLGHVVPLPSFGPIAHMWLPGGLEIIQYADGHIESNVISKPQEKTEQYVGRR